MKKTGFLKNHKITDATADGAYYRHMRVRDIWRTLREFAAVFFSEELDIVQPEALHGIVYTDPEALACFVKCLVCELHGETVLSITVATDDEHVMIRFSGGSELANICKHSVPAIKFAKQSGFAIKYTSTGIVLIASVEREAAYYLHAIDSYSWDRTLRRIFFGA